MAANPEIESTILSNKRRRCGVNYETSKWVKSNEWRFV